jgi:hypothetical protein
MSLVTPLRRVNGHTTSPGTLAEAVARGESTAGHRQSPAIMPRGSLAGHLFTDQPLLQRRAFDWRRLVGIISRGGDEKHPSLELARDRLGELLHLRCPAIVSADVQPDKAGGRSTSVTTSAAGWQRPQSTVPVAARFTVKVVLKNQDVDAVLPSPPTWATYLAAAHCCR